MMLKIERGDYPNVGATEVQEGCVVFAQALMNLAVAYQAKTGRFPSFAMAEDKKGVQAFWCIPLIDNEPYEAVTWDLHADGLTCTILSADAGMNLAHEADIDPGGRDE